MKGTGCRLPAFAIAVASLLVSGLALADVTVTDVSSWKAQRRAANQQKKAERKLRRGQPAATGRVSALDAGSVTLVDASGLEYFINTNITSATTSSASGAASEASSTGPVQATTSAGGTVSTTLTDAFDGYFGLCLSQTATGPGSTGDSAYVFYNDNGAASLDATCAGRQVVFGTQTIYGLSVTRKVFVPSNDSFARWQTILSNPTAAPVTVNVIAANNLGSDSDSLIDSTSSGDAAATSADYWVSTWQNWGDPTATQSSDPRLAHVMWGPGGSGPNTVNFANGNDNPYWSIPVTVPPGQTRILLHFVTGQPSKAAARAKATQIAVNPLPLNAVACMTDLQRSQVVNFASAVGEAVIPALGRTGLLALVAAIGAAGLLAHRRLA